MRSYNLSPLVTLHQISWKCAYIGNQTISHKHYDLTWYEGYKWIKYDTHIPHQEAPRQQGEQRGPSLSVFPLCLIITQIYQSSTTRSAPAMRNVIPDLPSSNTPLIKFIATHNTDATKTRMFMSLACIIVFVLLLLRVVVIASCCYCVLLLHM
jgi:hypothetical protein